MAEVVVRIPTPLRQVTNGEAQIPLECNTVLECINLLDSKFPGIKARLCDETGAVLQFINIFLNDEDIESLDGMRTAISTGDEINIVPAVAGG